MRTFAGFCDYKSCVLIAGRTRRAAGADRSVERQAARELNRRSAAADNPGLPSWTVRSQGELNGGAGVPAPVSTWELMLELWPLEERPDNMRKREVVNALTFDQMVTYKKLFDQRMKREGKGEQVFGHDVPIPVTVFEAGPDDCAEQLHAVR
jgi:hypothetical protein